MSQEPSADLVDGLQSRLCVTSLPVKWRAAARSSGWELLASALFQSYAGAWRGPAGLRMVQV